MDDPLPSLRSFHGKVAEAFELDKSAGYIWVNVADMPPHEAVNLTFFQRTGDPDAPWAYADMEDPEGTDAYPALLEERVDWFGPNLRLVWLSEEEAAAVGEELQFRNPFGGSTVWSELKSDIRELGEKLRSLGRTLFNG
jgi:hypothetical protein